MPSAELKRQYVEMKKRQRKARMKQLLEEGVADPETSPEPTEDPLARLVDALRPKQEPA